MAPVSNLRSFAAANRRSLEEVNRRLLVDDRCQESTADRRDFVSNNGKSSIFRKFRNFALFLVGMGRGRGETRGGLRQVGGIGGEPYDHSPILRSTSVREQQRASEEEWTPPPQNTRAQGLYDPNNPRGTEK